MSVGRLTTLKNIPDQKYVDKTPITTRTIKSLIEQLIQSCIHTLNRLADCIQRYPTEIKSATDRALFIPPPFGHSPLGSSQVLGFTYHRWRRVGGCDEDVVINLNYNLGSEVWRGGSCHWSTWSRV